MGVERTYTRAELLEELLDDFSKEESALIERAWVFAERRYTDIRHPSGDLYLDYALHIAQILANLGSDTIVIAASLLYPPLPFYMKSYPELETEFKEQTELLRLIRELHTLSNLEWDSWPIDVEEKDIRTRKDVILKMYLLAIEGDGLETDSLERKGWEELNALDAARFQKREKQVENIIRMFLASIDDVRALLIRLADRLYFMRRLKYISDAEKKALRAPHLARITLAVYAPLADRLGLWQMKSELEDMSFRLIDMDTYKAIAGQLTLKKEERAEAINEIIPLIQNALAEYVTRVEVSGRAKHIYSIYKKMEAKQLTLNEINDLLGIRIIVESNQDCYDVQEIILDTWPAMTSFYDGESGRDWIATPKENGYQSLHTTIRINGKIVEVQIRTFAMHEQAEFGAAAEHWRYKDPKIYRKGKLPRVTKEKDLNWGKGLAEQRKMMENQPEVTDQAQKDLLKERIYVITPKGHVIDFPQGATPLDFAYRIHTDLGHRYSGARVDRHIVRLDYHLKNGEIVELIASRARSGPNPEWLARSKNETGESSPIFARTRNTRAKIQSWINKHETEV